MPGRLVLCASPIGNLGDAPPRLRNELASADLVYAEDTRRSAKLLAALEVQTPLRSYFAGNEPKRAGELEKRLAGGQRIALLTDAGTPGVADPGVSAVRAAVKAGAEVTIVPGPSAVTAALAVSGFGADRFVFEGFLPRRGKQRQERLAAIAVEERTVVVFSAPHGAAEDLRDLAEVAGERAMVVARELTKAHEEVWRGSAREAADRWDGDVQPVGEFTIVVAGGSSASVDLEGALGEVRREMSRGASLSAAVRGVAEAAGVPRRQLYEAALRMTGDE